MYEEKDLFIDSHLVKWKLADMLETIDTHRALQAVERLQAKLRERGDTANEEKLSLLKSVLQSPLFNQILNLQASLPQPRDQVGQQHKA
uniref:Uncharacterized protein n=1 Tax=Sphaerodactylus townsendi TaxID=933632 RepID=A0ACB8ERR6_9SAUR